MTRTKDDKALWATQGGGTALWDGHRFVFVESPAWWPAQEGKPVPPEWGLQPINDAAQRIAEIWRDQG